ncbi:hypothetical protein K504DRAFT_381201, partial [Pleomassaria siparia CBS 279.74]
VSRMESLESFHRRLDGTAISTYILILILVPLKLWCRKRAGGWRNIGPDDAVSVLALLAASVLFWLCMIGMRPFLGRQAGELDISQLVSFLFYVWLAQLVYVTSIVLIKFSILAFYWRLFALTARIPILIITFIVFAWFTSFFLLVIFECGPISAAWDLTIKPTRECVPVKTLYLGGAIPNVITDIIMVIMPIPYVWRLHAPLGQRIILAGMFMLGLFIGIVSIVRLTIFLGIPIAASANVTYNFREVIVWSLVEVNIGLTCACLPSLRPAVTFIGLNKLFSSGNTRPSNATPGPHTDGRPSQIGQSSGGLRSGRKKGSTGGMFSTLAGLTKLGSEEDVVDSDSQRQIFAHGHGKGDVELERRSHDMDADGNREERKAGGIVVQKDWSVRRGQTSGE